MASLDRLILRTKREGQPWISRCSDIKTEALREFFRVPVLVFGVLQTHRQ